MDRLNLIEILLVEDNASDMELMKRALKKGNIDNHLLSVEDGAAALDFIFCRAEYANRDIKYSPKIVFLDLKLPKVNGLEVLQEIKSDPRTKHIPVVIVSSSQEDSDIRKAYLLGANSYIVKPVAFDEYQSVIVSISTYWLKLNTQFPN